MHFFTKKKKRMEALEEEVKRLDEKAKTLEHEMCKIAMEDSHYRDDLRKTINTLIDAIDAGKKRADRLEASAAELGEKLSAAREEREKIPSAEQILSEWLNGKAEERG